MGGLDGLGLKAGFMTLRFVWVPELGEHRDLRGTISQIRRLKFSQPSQPSQTKRCKWLSTKRLRGYGWVWRWVGQRAAETNAQDKMPQNTVTDKKGRGRDPLGPGGPSNLGALTVSLNTGSRNTP